MQNYKTVLLVVFFSTASVFIINEAIAQSSATTEEARYLINLSETKLSGFGNTHSEATLVGNRIAYVSGASGAFLFNYTFYAGIYSLGLESRHLFEDIYPATHHPDNNVLQPTHINNRLQFNHGGLMLGYIHNPNKLWHINTNIKFGRGKIALMDKNFNFLDFEQHHRDWVGVITPEVDIEVNLTRWCKLGFSFGYRWVYGVDNRTYTNAKGKVNQLFNATDFSSPTFGVKVHFGGFGPRNNGRNNSNGN